MSIIYDGIINVELKGSDSVVSDDKSDFVHPYDGIQS